MSNVYWSQLTEYCTNKNILVFGVGKQGGAQVAQILFSAGANVRITDLQTAEALAPFLTDLDPKIETSLGGHQEADIHCADIIIKNPAVPFAHPLIEQAIHLGKTVTTETALALQYIRRRTIGISGTRGKTTTTSLIHHILQTAEKPTVIGGNIPNAPTLSLLKTASPETWFVLEISSFQLEAMDREHLSPAHAILTNIYPDHLNRYPTMEAYAKTKTAIYRWQQPGDHAYWNGDKQWAALIEEALADGVTFHDGTSQPATHQPSQLPGQHNQENIALASEVAKTLGVPDATLQAAVASFSGVAHRLQTVETINGTTFINDSTSTTPIALEKATEAIPQPYVLLAGGATKHLPFSEKLLATLHTIAPHTIWLAGSGTTEILTALYGSNLPESIHIVPELNQAVAQAYQLAQQENIPTVLFSPGFTSFEMFDNEFHRGDTFVSLVKQLSGQE